MTSVLLKYLARPAGTSPTVELSLSKTARNWAVRTCILVALSIPGCCTQVASNAIPANRLPPELCGVTRSGTVPIDFSLLRQPPPDGSRVGPRDVLGVYIQDILPSERETVPVVAGVSQLTREYFPPTGIVNSPSIGIPIAISEDGTLALPLINTPLHVNGMTVDEVTNAVRKAYTVDQRLLQPGRDRILITLMKQRVHRVLVIREDSEAPGVTRRGETIATKRGSAAVIDLAASENDVLHALIASGGLPGQDAYNAVWIIHGSPSDFSGTAMNLDAGGDPRTVLKKAQESRHFVRIPLRMCEGEPVPISPKDIILNDGDIVYIESRVTEFFYVGGLMEGAQIPLPRDYDLDVLGAISLGGGSVAGTPGGPASVTVNARSGPGTIIPPSRVIILRTLPDGEQIKIRVDINEAFKNPKERIRILPGDVVMLLYKPHETVGNTLLNLVNFNITGVFGSN